MPDPSAEFLINGQPITESVAVAEGDPVVCELIDIAGVSPVKWGIVGVDDTTVIGDYSFAQSGSVGQIYTGTALAPGKAGVVEVRVASGISPSEGLPSDNLTKRGKFYTPTVAGLEVLTTLEYSDTNNVSSAAYGMIKPVNEAIRGVAAESVSEALAGSTVDVWTYEMPEDSSLGIEVKLNAWDVEAKDTAFLVAYAAWSRKGAAAPTTTTPGFIAGATFKDAGAAAWVLSADVNGNFARVRFTGDVGAITKYRAKVEFLPFIPV